MPAPLGRRDRAVAVGVGLAAALARVWPLAFGVESTDIQLYRLQGLPVTLGQNIYRAAPGVFPYPPPSMFFPAACLRLSALTGWPFHLLIKSAAVASDCGIAVALYWLGARLVAPRRALVWGLLYAFCPASILIASFHGNIMPLPTLLMLCSYLLFCVDARAHLRSSALLLAFAVGLRSFPILLLPLFLAALPSRRDRLVFAAYVLVPNALWALPFFALDPRAFVSATMLYGGWGLHHGLFGLLRALRLMGLGYPTWDDPPGWALLFPVMKTVFLLGYGALVWKGAALGLGRRITLSLLLFCLVYASVTSQYLVWALPFLLLFDLGSFAAFALAATAALLAFYALFFPDILFGRLTAPELSVNALLRAYAAGEFLLCAAAAAAMLRISQAAKPAPEGLR